MATAEKTPWQAEGEEKREKVRQMFAEIAPRYDLVNSLMSFSRHRHWRAFAVSVLNLSQGDRALDVCSGTGDFIAPLRKAVGDPGSVAGLDFCLPMLEIAKKKGVPGSLLEGDACRLPIRDASVNAVSVGWGIRNVPDIDAAHREMARVLKPGGRLVSVDMAKPRNPIVRLGSKLVGRGLLPLLGSIFGARKAYTYLPKSTEKFLSRQELRESMERAGLKDVRWKDFMFGNICIHWGTKP
jgi:demethylmenaquinone methyltransferase/2-methoxy-6-polyprenyl-1,4-benzoquinol methylase